METWGACLKRYREAAGITRYRLAVASGVPQGNVCRFEQGKRDVPTAETVRCIADGLGLTGEARAAFFADVIVIVIVTRPYRDAASAPARKLAWTRTEVDSDA
jgi:transcriptional regulator with XRE-family HTH domain